MNQNYYGFLTLRKASLEALMETILLPSSSSQELIACENGFLDYSRFHLFSIGF
jgi:hypothetical protein